MNTSMISSRVKATLMICVLFLAKFTLFAQPNRIDLLEENLLIIPTAKSFDATSQLALEYFDVDNKKGLEYSRKANSIAYSIKDSLGIVKSFRLLGQMQRRLNNLDSSVYYFKKCLSLAERLHSYEEMHYILNGMGITFSYQAKYDESLHYHLQALNIASIKKDSARIDRSLLNLGLVYYKLSNYPMALEYYDKSLQMKIAINEKLDLDFLKMNICLCYAFLEKTDEARTRLKGLIKSCIPNCNDLLITIHYTSRVIWYKSDSLVRAEKDFLQSHSFAKLNDNTRYEFDNIIYLSKVYQRKNNFYLAERFLKEGEALAIASHFDFEEVKLHEEFCALYAAKRDYQKLSHYREKYIQLKDSVFNERHTNNLMRLHAESVEKENKHHLAAQAQQMQPKQEIIGKCINILIRLAIILLAVLAHLLVRILRARKAANIQLNKKVTERTLELELNFKDLALANLDRISNDLNRSLQFMRVQCWSGVKDEINPDSNKYFKEIETTTAP